ncbi:kinase-like domain-containing protein [Rhizophagus clarus]|uniref:Kinase-like domain-containing protein n=1 Tax=Rhizophagus clarus TaxID=94130 RepID=A0A8H3QUL4_9GLOM|nr:kinase-like domain-containing protein [Rhizophagus clarus]
MDKEKSIKSLYISKELNTICEKCGYGCNAIYFQQNFKNWTSGNKCIDKLIQDTQLSAHYDVDKALEWIPYDRLNNIKYTAETEIYKANWIDGYSVGLDIYGYNQNASVTLRILDNFNNVTLEFINEIRKDHVIYGITQDPETGYYMIVFNNKCKECDYICIAMLFQQNFENWTSGNNDIDKLIQDAQLLTHTEDELPEVLEWVPYNRFNNIKYTAEAEVYKANWIDGYLHIWDNYNKFLMRYNQNMYVTLKILNNFNNITLEFISEIKMDYIIYGITQDPETRDYMMVLNNKCEICDELCSAMLFQQNFENWTSGNDDIDKLIQDIQLSIHDNYKGFEKVLEWIPYYKLNNIDCINTERKMYRANWIDGCINKWDYENQNWKRYNQNVFVILKNLSNPKNIELEIMNEINKSYGITQNPQTNDYMMVLSNICNKCDCTCSAMQFQQKFGIWTSANWIDGYIYNWDIHDQNWKRFDKNTLITLKSLNNPKDITLEFINKIKEDYEFYGITQDLQTKNYKMVLKSKCKKCNKICSVIIFQQNFENWTSGNSNIDKFIQYTQLSAHDYNDNNDNDKVFEKVLEWIPYDRFNNIKYTAERKVYKADWIDGCIWEFNYYDRNFIRYNQNMYVTLSILNNSNNISLDFMNEMRKDHIIYGITQDPITKNYMMVLNDKCKKCGYICNAIQFQRNFENWTSGNNDIDKFIHDNQLLAHNRTYNTIEWIPYDKFYNIKYIAKGGFGIVYKANWTDGCIGYRNSWDYKNQNWNREDQNMSVALKSLNNSKNITSEFMNEVKIHNKVSGVISGLPPYHDVNHDNYLAIKICHGLRPRFDFKVPQLIVYLIKNCLNANPLNRPTAKEIYEILDPSYNVELENQIKEVEKLNNNPLIENTVTNLGLSYEIHSEAIYTSRLLNFNNLPEPKNSYDYYAKNDNIISKEFSDSLQLRISQLNINKSESLQINLSQLNINENDQNDDQNDESEGSRIKRIKLE